MLVFVFVRAIAFVNAIAFVHAMLSFVVQMIRAICIRASQEGKKQNHFCFDAGRVF